LDVEVGKEKLKTEKAKQETIKKMSKKLDEN